MYPYMMNQHHSITLECVSKPIHFNWIVIETVLIHIIVNNYVMIVNSLTTTYFLTELPEADKAFIAASSSVKRW